MRRPGNTTLPAPAMPWSGWTTLKGAVPALLLGLATFGLLFHREIVAAVQVWIASTAFGHCFVVLPVAAYLAWDRRRQIALQPLQPTPWAALAAVPLAAVWFAAERLGVMEGRQLVAIGFVELLFLAVLGWRLWAACSAALLYLFFLVPFGAFLVPELQVFTAHFITLGLSILGIPYYADAFTIEISAGIFFVAEACAGLRFLIATIAFGALYASLFYRNPVRRAAFIAACIVVPVIANGFRGLGIVLLGQLRGSAQAAAVDHIVYGWLFFSAVLFLMILVGLLFREDGAANDPMPMPQVGRPATGHSRTMPAALAVTAAMAVGPALALVLDSHAAAQSFVMAAPQFASGPGCTVLSAVAAPDVTLMPGHTGAQHFACSGVAVTAVSEAFPPRSNPSLLFAAARAAGEGGDPEEMQRSTLTSNQAEPRNWDLVETTRPVRLTATSLWIDGAPSPGGLTSRLRQAWNSLAGSANAPILLAVSATPDDTIPSSAERHRARDILASFLDAQDTLATQIGSLSAAAERASNAP